MKYACGVEQDHLAITVVHYWNPVHDHEMVLHGHAYHQGFNFNDWLVIYNIATYMQAIYDKV